MKQLKKRRVIELAKESGLVFNTELLDTELFDWHADAIFNFYILIRKELKENETNRQGTEVQNSHPGINQQP